MRGLRRQTGFTLVEILIATVMMGIIVTLVYGTYTATTQSVHRGKSRAMLMRQGRALVTQMARQIRCAYVDPVDLSSDERSSVPKSSSLMTDTPIYFLANQDVPGGELLHLVSSAGALYGVDAVSGLIEAQYRFNPASGKLQYRQRPFAGCPIDDFRGPWLELASHLQAIEVSFHDGRQWLDQWDTNRMQRLPVAVKLELLFSHKTAQQIKFQSIVQVALRQRPNGTDGTPMVKR